MDKALQTFCLILLAATIPACGQMEPITPVSNLATIIITPASAKLALNSAYTFSAKGYDHNGNIVVISPTWTVSGGIGTMAGTTLTASASGEGEVKATVGSVSGSSAITVTGGPLFAVMVTPNPATVFVGKTLQFQAYGQDTLGNQVSIAPVWTVTGVVGSVDQKGLFGAVAEGVGTVNATAGTIFGSAVVTTINFPDI